MAFDFSLVKKHPVGTTGAVLVGGLALWFVFKGTPSAGNAPGTSVVYAGSSTPTDNSQALQAQQISGQLAALGVQSQTQIALAQLKNQGDATAGAYQYQIAQLSAGVQMAHDQNAADIAHYQTQAQLDALTTQYQAMVQQTSISANSNVAMAALNADTAKYTSSLNAQLQTTLAQTQQAIAGYNAFSNAQIATANAQAYSSAAKAQASASKTQTYAGLVMGLANLFAG
jgi:hypothetical protein